MPRMASSAASPSDKPRARAAATRSSVRALEMRDTFNLGAAEDVGQGGDLVPVRVRFAAFGCLEDSPGLGLSLCHDDDRARHGAAGAHGNDFAIARSVATPRRPPWPVYPRSQGALSIHLALVPSHRRRVT